MKALITGVTGFKGSHLAEYLLDVQGVEVHGVRRPRSRDEFVDDRVVYHEGDITDLAAMSLILREVRPTWLWHLAAQSFVPLSWRAPLATWQCNLMGTVSVLEAVRRESPETVVVVAGSSEEYGEVLPEECPIDETNDLRPMSPYGGSKVAADLAAQIAYRSHQLRTVITRAFNTTGPRRGESFVTSSFAKQIAQLEKNGGGVLQHGNLAAVRDFTDVRDMVRGYWLAANAETYGAPLNMCSGYGMSMREVLNTLWSLSNADIETQQDLARMRPSDVPLLIGDCSRFRALTGWTPQYDFLTTMTDLLNYWRERV